MQTHPGGRFPYHSDEIVRDLRPLPFYPFLCGGTAQKGTCCRIQFYGVEYNTMRAETQGAVCYKFFTVRPLEIAPPLLTPGERCTVSLAVGCTFPAGLPQAVESGQTMYITP